MRTRSATPSDGGMKSSRAGNTQRQVASGHSRASRATRRSRLPSRTGASTTNRWSRRGRRELPLCSRQSSHSLRCTVPFYVPPSGTGIDRRALNRAVLRSRRGGSREQDLISALTSQERELTDYGSRSARSKIWNWRGLSPSAWRCRGPHFQRPTRRCRIFHDCQPFDETSAEGPPGRVASVKSLILERAGGIVDHQIGTCTFAPALPLRGFSMHRPLKSCKNREKPLSASETQIHTLQRRQGRASARRSRYAGRTRPACAAHPSRIHVASGLTSLKDAVRQALA
jgi:hypothetical protein